MEFTDILKSFHSFFSPSPLIKKPNTHFTVMIVSPHPDDECIMSSLALRLMHENNANIINIAVTLGSNPRRQLERTKELEAACDHLEIENIVLGNTWSQKTKELKSLIQKYQPNLILCSHNKDHHPTHIKTAELLKKVLLTLKKQSILIAWSEFWAPLSKPNLLLEVPEEILRLQMEALSKHSGEVDRNPYHLRLPAWMMDNVRRGSELIGGAGASSSLIPYAVLYQIQHFHQGAFKKVNLDFSELSTYADIGQMFKLILEEASGSKTKVK